MWISFSFCRFNRQIFRSHLFVLKSVILAVVVLFLCNSCIITYTDKLACEIQQKEGVKIYGKTPWWGGFIFVPCGASSQYHIFNNVQIDYKKTQSGDLDDINMYLMGEKLNLGSLEYNDVLAIVPKMPDDWKKVVTSYRHWDNTINEYIAFIIKESYQYGQYAAVDFCFDSDKNIEEIFIVLPIGMNTIVRFENMGKSIEACFPFHEKDMRLIFGEAIKIYKYYYW